MWSNTGFGIGLQALTELQNIVFALHIHLAAYVLSRKYLSQFHLQPRSFLAARFVQDEKDALVDAAQYKMGVSLVLNKK